MKMRFYTNVAVVKGRLLVRGYDEHGRQVKETVRYQPSFFVENENCDSDYRTLDGRKVMRIEKKSIYEANQYLKDNSDVSNKVIYGYDQFVYTYINENFNGPIDYDQDLIRVANIDIETESDEGMPDIETANKPVTAITVMYGSDILSFGCGEYTPSDPDVTYIRCDTEEEMLEKFLQSWEWYSPDVVTGWYIENFDIPYIVNRLKRLLGEKSAARLSPWGHLREKVVLEKGKMKTLYFPTGVALLDYIKIYKKMELEPRESYSLNFIASVEVGAKKLDYCLAPDTKILTSDLRHVNADSLTVGMELIGFDEFRTGKRHKLQLTKVTSIKKLKQPCYRIVTNRGSVVCSSRHRWLARTSSPTMKRTNYEWIETQNLRVGNCIPRLTDVWETASDYDSGWVAGFLDGEGYVTKTSIGLTQNKGPLFDRYVNWLTQNEYPVTINDRHQKLNAAFTTNRKDMWRLLGTVRPERLIKNVRKYINGTDAPGKTTGFPDEIISIEFLGEMDVIAVGTEHKTLIANGLMSHNSEYESLFSLYKENFPKFMDYNILDVRLVNQIDQKKRMLQLTFLMAYTAHCNFEDINSPVRMWEAICYNDLINQNIVFPPRQNITGPSYIDNVDGEDEESIEGGYVKEPIPGLYKWVTSIDLKSSYPHQIMQFNVSPETYRGRRSIPYDIEDYLAEKLDTEMEDLRKQNLVAAASGCLFDRRTQGFLPRLLSQWFDTRDEFKKIAGEAKKLKETTTDKNLIKALDAKIADYDLRQKVYKVAINSAYGALANKWFRFYNFDLAESVTACGRLAVRWAEKRLNEYMNNIMFTKDVDYVIAMDTDSVYLNMGPLIQKKYGDIKEDAQDKTAITNMLDLTIKNKIEPYLEDCYRDLQKRVNASMQKMQMNRESIADVGIWTGKKRYILNIIDKEGVRFATPKVEIKGMDSVRSSTPPSCREAIKSLIKIIIEKDEDTAQEFIDKFKEEFKTLPFDQIAFPRGINGLEKWADEALLCKKGTPVQVRGALVYNRMLEEKGVKNFQPLYDGDKAKFCYLETPNPVRSYVITVPHAIPKAFKLDDKIDRDKQFEIGFLNPVTKIFEAIGWRTEPEGNTLEDFMAGKL